jgi:phage FluMu protein Com
MKNVKELNLQIGEKYTVLKPNGLTSERIYGTLQGYYFDKYAQYENAIYLYIKRPRARKVNRIIITSDTTFIFKGEFKEAYNKELISDNGATKVTKLNKWTYEDIKDNDNLVYYHEFREEIKPTTDKYEYLIDKTGDFMDLNNIRPVEAPENESYIEYVRSLLAYFNINDLKNYISELGYSLLEKSINKALEYNW